MSGIFWLSAFIYCFIFGTCTAIDFCTLNGAIKKLKLKNEIRNLFIHFDIKFSLFFVRSALLRITNRSNLCAFFGLMYPFFYRYLELRNYRIFTAMFYNSR